MNTHNRSFDPNAAASDDSGVFGLPYSEKESMLILIPVPWEVTTSYGGGTSNGPSAILEASKQVDLYDLDIDKPYTPGISMCEESKEIRDMNDNGKSLAASIIEVGGHIEDDSPLKGALSEVNELSKKLNEKVFQETLKYLEKDKIVGILGGDHSVPLGAFQAIAKKMGKFGILHFDAHSDTRKAYEGFQYSHASIMYNALSEVSEIEKITQVGIRDFCEEEIEFCKSQGDRVKIFFDGHLAQKKAEGTPFLKIAQEIVNSLPKQVWVSFDIDGLDPKLCPNTGTPVPGGLEFQEANIILKELVKSGRKIIGFDLNEVSPDPEGKSEWDANVGARLLYKLCGYTFASQKLTQLA